MEWKSGLLEWNDDKYLHKQLKHGAAVSDYTNALTETSTSRQMLPNRAGDSLQNQFDVDVQDSKSSPGVRSCSNRSATMAAWNEWKECLNNLAAENMDWQMIWKNSIEWGLYKSKYEVQRGKKNLLQYIEHFRLFNVNMNGLFWCLSSNRKCCPPFKLDIMFILCMACGLPSPYSSKEETCHSWCCSSARGGFAVEWLFSHFSSMIDCYL